MLKIENIKKTFNKGEVTEKEVIKDLSMTIKDGDFITVIGGNGAGKSTLLNLIAGSLSLDSGKIILDDKDISALKEYERAAFISRVFQDPLSGTCPDLTLAENLSLAKRRGKRHTLKKGITRQEKAEYRELLASLGLDLEGRLDDKVGVLSGGKRQAFTVVMATLVTPKLLLLDEATAALDPKTSKVVLELIEKIVKHDHITTFMITHDMQDALDHGDRLIMMDEGDIILDIAKEEKAKMSINDLLIHFEKASGHRLKSDSLLLS